MGIQLAVPAQAGGDGETLVNANSVGDKGGVILLHGVIEALGTIGGDGLLVTRDASVIATDGGQIAGESGEGINAAVVGFALLLLRIEIHVEAGFDGMAAFDPSEIVE